MIRKMKRIIITVAAIFMTLIPALAGTFSKSYPLKGFSGIRATHIFNVTVRASGFYSVKVEAPDYLEPYLVVELDRGQLVLRVARLPRDVERKLSREKNGSLRAEVSMPALESVALSGAARLDAEGDFEPLGGKTFRLDLSGATHASGLSVQAAAADIRLSGASSAGLKGNYGKVGLESSGASKSRLGIDAVSVNAELSGSSSLDLEGEFDRISVEASGASHADLQSTATLSSLNIECSGASSVNGRNAKAEDVSVEVSGASNCKVSALRSLTVEATGASTCFYEDTGTKVDIVQVSRGAALKKL